MRWSCLEARRATRSRAATASTRLVTDLAGTLWFDAEGDNDLSGAFDVKIADMSLSSAITGFDQNQLLISCNQFRLGNSR